MRLPALSSRPVTTIASAFVVLTLVATTAACGDSAETPNASATTPATSTVAPTTAAPTSAAPTNPSTAGPTTAAPAQPNGSTPAPAATSQPSASTQSSPQASPKASAKSSASASATPKPKPTATSRAKPRIALSKSTGLDPDGQWVTVTGRGFDTNKGVYIALCVKPAAGQQPTPCGGGADTSGTSGASAWVSSNPPRYAVNLVKPYGPGGTFTVKIKVGAEISKSIDCRTTACVIGARNDHTRSTDRSQDVLVPVTFARS